MIEKIPEMDAHYEYRVRIAAGELMGTLCNLGGTEVFDRFLPRIKQGIEENLDRDPLEPEKERQEAQKELDLVTVSLCSIVLYLFFFQFFTPSFFSLPIGHKSQFE